jgi:C4-dicarboxylate transporter DctQ subunit
VTVLSRIDRALAKVEEILLFVMVLALILLASTQVVWRNVLIAKLGSPKIWIDEMLGVMTFSVGLLGAALAAHAGQHITIDVMGRVIPPGRARIAVRLVTNVATIVIVVLLLHASLVAVKSEREGYLPSDELVASWQGMAAIPGAFGLILFHFGVRLARDALAFVRGKDEDGAAHPLGTEVHLQ